MHHEPSRASSSSTPRRVALVTGASAGIGEALARVYAERGYDLVLTARREGRLEALAAELRGHGAACHVIAADLADAAAPAYLESELRSRGLAVDALVNNAGYGLGGTFATTEWNQQRDFLQVMVTAVCELTHRLLPSMIERRFGRVLNVSSLAGLIPSPGGQTLYGAAKAFLVKFSQSVGLEVRPHGVHVTALCPGYTYSEFHDVGGTREKVNTLPKALWQTSEEVAREGYDAVERGDLVAVPGRLNRALAGFVKVAPEGLILPLLERQAQKIRKR